MDNRNQHPGSLVTKNWDPKKQDIWVARKASAVTQAVEHLTIDKPSFERFYDFLIEKRVKIAEELTPKLVAEIGTRREKSFNTEISNVNGYADYLDSVIELFDDLFNKAKPDDKGEEDKENAGMANMFANYFAISRVSANNEKISNKGYVSVDVKNNDANYSKIYKFNREIEESGEKSALIVISHPSDEMIKKALSEASKLFHELQTVAYLSDFQKIDKIKQIAWHVFQAMPQARGSAAIGEMLIESLLKYHNIEFKLERNLELQTNKEAPTIDLIAMLTATPENFCKRVKLNSTIELSVTLETNLKDKDRIEHVKYIDSVGMPSLRNYIEENGKLTDKKMNLGDRLKLIEMYDRLAKAIMLSKELVITNPSDSTYTACSENLMKVENQLLEVIIKHELIYTMIAKNVNISSIFNMLIEKNNYVEISNLLNRESISVEKRLELAQQFCSQVDAVKERGNPISDQMLSIYNAASDMLNEKNITPSGQLGAIR